MPRGGTLRIDGLPPLALLSEGHATRPGSWTIPLSRLATLKITAPATEDVKPRLTITLATHDGIVVSEVRPLLAVVPAWRLGGLQAPPLEPTGAPCCAGTARPVEKAPPAAWVSRGVREEAEGLVRRGDEALQRGNVEAARRIYEYAAAEMRWPAAAVALAATYDPHELGRVAPLVKPDAEAAHTWYARARDLANARMDFFEHRLDLP
jgi:hypothetical protein